MKKVLFALVAFIATVAFIPQTNAQTSVTTRVTFTSDLSLEKMQSVYANQRLAPAASNEFDGKVQLKSDNQVFINLKRTPQNEAFYRRLKAKGKLEINQPFALPQDLVKNLYQNAGKKVPEAMIIPNGSHKLTQKGEPYVPNNPSLERIIIIIVTDCCVYIFIFD
jgi:hypothetical protein